ncbi:DUF6286 domain-containing protein [Brachybacterium saurashtrense]|uniref:Alkaline shock response membrane anchor protein AmaP n=1 Tax=Brachybacterium saurashtrense TaxID=556288 RepID=A0A345YRI4_9MICO|nr:DUF6286 domain-containing protein [Brachybacterium saurashtrense]AXK46536.1 alkaline shock response membrane anchor protein AmaP [Brachybacterium saurashtrense]RRR24277.1 alkaline shock response membrane anchor protein AmaP [Brachybacterium saurashtrense]
MSSAPPRLVRRPARSVPAALLGVLLLTGGLVGVWLLGSLLLDGSWPASAQGALADIGARRLDSTPVLIAAGVLAALGLVLLLAAAIPGRPSRRLVLGGEVPGASAVPHRDLGRRITRRVETVDGVHSARATLRGRRLDVLARTVVDDSEAVLRGARAAAEQAVDELRPETPLRTRVRVQRIRKD